MRDGLLNIDTTAYLWFNRLQQRSSITTAARWVSHTGDGYFYAALAVLIFLFADIHAGLFVKAGLLAFCFEVPGFMALKAMIRRDRPFVQIPDCQSAIQPHDKFSMPSGHTAAAFLMASLISYCYPEFALLAYGWATLIGTSRVVLGVHYPGDIVVGALLGYLCTWISLGLVA
ncbi:MAG: hypothetical protein RLZZ385_2578 [Pseudomonadota bacterium]|jgi:undecaprenyl-diphosphatase